MQNAQENVCVGVSFNKVSRLQACKFIKKGLQDRCLFPVNLVKFLRTCILENISELLLLPISNTTLGQTTLQNPSSNIATQEEEKIQFESESFKSKLSLH